MINIVKCPKCKGKGKVYDIAMGICTCGISTFFEFIDDNLKEYCPRCGGSGFLKLV